MRAGAEGIKVQITDVRVRKITKEGKMKAIVTITICTARPGIVIGKGGQDVDKINDNSYHSSDSQTAKNVDRIMNTHNNAIFGFPPKANDVAMQPETRLQQVIVFGICFLILISFQYIMIE